MTVEALGLSSKTSPGRIAKVEVLGARQTAVWKQTESGLTIKVPESISGIPEYGVTLKPILSKQFESAGPAPGTLRHLRLALSQPAGQAALIWLRI